jgi:hypothetical protein
MANTTLETAALGGIGNYLGHAALHVTLLDWSVAASLESTVSIGMGIIGVVGVFMNHLYWESKEN